MKTPRDLSGAELAKALRKLGYVVTRQSGSHLRITTQENGEHHEAIPNHSPIKIGTLKSILRNIATHHGIAISELLESLDF
ncbi:MAG: type II toxin-antitoxin system HicA family toxin [Verrucomicrobiota bacterium]|nr:type II toxin-antitoxin system HicA family toxin [Verrucomicrobiota bacterium]